MENVTVTLDKPVSVMLKSMTALLTLCFPQVSVINFNVTVAKNKKSLSAQ